MPFSCTLSTRLDARAHMSAHMCGSSARTPRTPENRRKGADLASGKIVRRLLSSEAERQLTQARELLASLRDALIRFGASSADETTLARSIRQLDEFFLLVVVGEFNAGKSAFINALLGQPVLQEGVTPTTDRIHLLAHGPSTTRHRQ